jgi:predicted permease
VALTPLLGLACARLLGIDGPALVIALLFLACPTAVASYVMADQLGGDAELAGRIVILATLLSGPALAVVILWA